MQDETEKRELLKLILDGDLGITFEMAPSVTIILVVLVLILLIFNAKSRFGYFRTFEIDEAEFGIGKQKVKLKPNRTDKQIAYQIWVELSTRKIGIRIDLEDDVIYEIYTSWYNFFSVTRDLLKDVPVSRFQRKDTEKIIRISIDVLNIGLRPHLTKWQARYRRWYEKELEKESNSDLSPQEIQKQYPNLEELKKDLLEVNDRLIGYREKMYQLISGLE
ncbi:hypothetical protein J6I75_00765 [Pseudidiomarina sp. 1APP75-27a]|uniref:hypothetical protein n=1 Tax=Pseudidiomarina terrestris TaxID=2820060 RepID=UPI002B053226|nr:hypothetical protein [Pseudidiomarina sp. 1APP75-27a]MEA3586891.1 hypothetical protein [Pseudidiomarina sp. 1APP75-27a]